MSVKIPEGFTSGPWYVEHVPSHGLDVKKSIDFPICHLRWSCGMYAKEEKRLSNDAKLIALAQEMADEIKMLRAALNDVINACGCTCGDGTCDYGASKVELIAARALLGEPAEAV